MYIGIGLIALTITTIVGYMYYIFTIRPTLTTADAADSKRIIIFLIFIIPVIAGLFRKIRGKQNTLTDYMMFTSIGIMLPPNLIVLRIFKYPSIMIIYMMSLIILEYKNINILRDEEDFDYL